jgi:hypothetical protein
LTVSLNREMKAPPTVLNGLACVKATKVLQTHKNKLVKQEEARKRDEAEGEARRAAELKPQSVNPSEDADALSAVLDRLPDLDLGRVLLRLLEQKKATKVLQTHKNKLVKQEEARKRDEAEGEARRAAVNPSEDADALSAVLDRLPDLDLGRVLLRLLEHDRLGLLETNRAA